LLRCARSDGARGVGVAFTTRTSLAGTSLAGHCLQTYRLPTQLCVLAASFTRALLVVLALFWKRAQGRPGARCSHGRLCARHFARKHRRRTTGQPRHPGLPCAMALRLMSRSPRGAMHCCPRHLAKDRKAWRTAFRAPGPHDFGTRDCARRACETIVSRDAAASTAARPACRDDRDTPLFLGPGCALNTTNQKFGQYEYFCDNGLTRRAKHLGPPARQPLPQQQRWRRLDD
jgi:hypothetical protein